jgi:Ala-tRNA(Pro) deacylase
VDSHQVKYVTIRYFPAFTAQEIPASAYMPSKQLAKLVMLKRDGQRATAVLPASDTVNVERLKAAGARTVALANEPDVQDRFHECEVGAMPPVAVCMA